MSAIALLWLRTNWRMAVAGSAALFVVGFILMALHWKAEAEKNRAAVRATNAALASSDRHAEAKAQIQTNVEQQSEPLRKLPDANVQIAPERRAAILHSVECVRNPGAASCRVPKELPAR